MYTPEAPAAPAPPPPEAPPPTPNAVLAYVALANAMRRGANWYFWIAGLSAVNTVGALSGTNFHFLLGLGITQVIDALALGLSKSLGGLVQVMAIGLDLTIVGVWAGLALWARKGSVTAFWVGMSLFALDTLVCLFFQDWLGVGFHVYALLGLDAGRRAAQQLRALPSPA